MMLADWLEELGHDPLGPVSSEAKALAVLEGGEADAAFVDLNLAAGNGYAVARALRARSLPFAIMSGYGRGQIADEFADCAQLGKPFDFESVRALVSAW
jgi:CheY-like chemotaxis protein